MKISGAARVLAGRSCGVEVARETQAPFSEELNEVRLQNEGISESSTRQRRRWKIALILLAAVAAVSVAGNTSAVSLLETAQVASQSAAAGIFKQYCSTPRPDGSEGWGES